MSKRYFKGIGFDLGDTLIEYENVPLNWKDLYATALVDVMKQCKVENTKENLQKAKDILLIYNTRENPRTREVTAEKIFTEILTAWGVYQSNYLQRSIKTFFSFFQMRARVFKDSIPTLQFLKQKAIKIGVFTDVPYGMGTDFVKKDVSEIKKYIDVLLSSVDIGYRKPEKKVFQTISKHLNIEKRCMIYVGNEEKDIVGANNAGIFSVLLDRHKTTKSFGENLKISSLHELKRLFL